jgi:UDP-glucose 4-epimerase
MNVLITGTSGLIGRALAASLSAEHTVTCLSRNPTEVDGVTTIQADFTSANTLQQLDDRPIDTLVHLAAVTGRGPESECLRVNVHGTYTLLRYLIDRGCEKFALASSIAAVGFQSPLFRPLELPIPDEHPCLDRHGYGVSKYLMEEVTRYLQLQNENLDIINIRLASIQPDAVSRPAVTVGPIPEQWTLGRLAVMSLSDAVQCFTLAATSPPKPGVRIMNAVGTQANAADPIPDILRAWYGPGADVIDFSHYERPGHERDPIYDITRIQTELGFVPQWKPVEEEK